MSVDPGDRLADAAVALARDGWRVFPCGRDKAPRTPNGFKDATSDVETVAAWDWRDKLIGAAIPDGIAVLDIDPRNDGDKTIRALADAERRLPRTRIVKTRSDGWHPSSARGRCAWGPRSRMGRGIAAVFGGWGRVPTAVGLSLRG